MADQNTPAAPSVIDGGAPTEQEAKLAAQVDTIGVDPQEEPAETPATPAAPADPVAAATPAAPAPAAPAAGPETPAEPEVPPAPPVHPAPEAPRDFEAAYAENQRKFDEGEVDGDAYQKELRAISKEEAKHLARVAIWEERQQSAAEASAVVFNTAAVAWEKANAAFMANPLRAQAMQQAIEAVAAKSPGIAPATMFEEAAKIAFEAFGYAPPAAVDGTAAIAAAVAARTPGPVPPTLANSPAAAAIEAPPGNSAYASLDGKDIGALEDAIARMTPEQQEAYLRDAPGATSTGIPS